MASKRMLARLHERLAEAEMRRQGYVPTRQGYYREHQLVTPQNVRRGVF